MDSSSKTDELGVDGSAGEISMDDIARCALAAQRERYRSLALLLAAVLTVLAGRDVLRFTGGQSLSFGIHLPSQWQLYAPALLLTLLLAVVVVAPMVGLGRSPHRAVRPEDVDVKLDDIYGADHHRASLRQLVEEYRHFATLELRYGARPPRAVLFEGPPGTGKTMAAKVLAREAGVPFLFVSASSFQSMYYGQTNRKLRSFFRKLRRLSARYGGAIGFIEEFDAIGVARSGLGGSSARDGVAGVVGELLVQLQSFDEPQRSLRRLLHLPEHGRVSAIRPRFLLLAATNRAADLDPALIRPGRFDRTITFDLPSRVARSQILEGLLERRSVAGSAMELRDTVELVASMTSGMSQAGLNRLVEEAGVLAWRRGEGTVRGQDLLDAVSSMTLGLSEGAPYSSAQKLRIAVHEAGHGCYAWLSRRPVRVGLVSVRKRGHALGLTASYEADDYYLQTETELMDQLSSLLAGLVAEELLLGEVSTGSQSDLERATELALGMVMNFAMRGTLLSSHPLSPSEMTSFLLGESRERERVELLLHEAKARASELLSQYEERVWSVVLRLVEQEELSEEELGELLGVGQSVTIGLTGAGRERTNEADRRP
jgi:ATP-dependent Zn protease